ncbi:uncharacterized protein LOC119273337 [Triticum dicoccoides]|uniref:uncharacterized protein LOC119273337 n=1 Tax=Triticum dicoccoides TaxID=85692 RepID=UPI00188EC124|nr:uncharacterized protein LOC119273337 [Triticum dicoccoides]XP_044337795.1 uncharacterized protein LOC123059254 [Triticum aestivum]
MGLEEDRVGEALQGWTQEGGVRFHLAGLGFLVALALVSGGLSSVDSSDPASTSCAAAACSKIAAVLCSDTRALALSCLLSDSLWSCGSYRPQETTHLRTISRLSIHGRTQLCEDIASWEFPLLLCKSILIVLVV